MARLAVAKGATFDRRRYPGLADGGYRPSCPWGERQGIGAHRYLLAAFESDPALAALVESTTQERELGAEAYAAESAAARARLATVRTSIEAGDQEAVAHVERLDPAILATVSRIVWGSGPLDAPTLDA